MGQVMACRIVTIPNIQYQFKHMSGALWKQKCSTKHLSRLELSQGRSESCSACYGLADNLQECRRHVCAIKCQVWPQLCSVWRQILLSSVQPA